ncbi:ninein-like [Gigantopelta aegis]|uniref:ninein-like n=1 Tax=Gigantopelta aegis TaxID=1735272 RepID=UPI001B888721|nr:ninein-like [Gigantopelta aegis]
MTSSAVTVGPARSYEQFLTESGLTKPEQYIKPRPRSVQSGAQECKSDHLMRSCNCQTSENPPGQSESESTECKDKEILPEQPAEIKILLSRCRELEKLKSDLQAELKVAQSKLNKIVDLESENEHLQEKLSSLYSEHQKMESLEVRTASLERECEEKNIEIRKLKYQIESLESLELENIELKHQVEGKILELQFLTSGDLSGMKSRLQKLASVERENRVLNEQLEEKMAELERFKRLYYSLLNKTNCAPTRESGQILRSNSLSDVQNKRMDEQEYEVGCLRCRNLNLNSSATHKFGHLEEENKLLNLQLHHQMKKSQPQECNTVSSQTNIHIEYNPNYPAVDMSTPDTSNTATSSTSNMTTSSTLNMATSNTSNLATSNTSNVAATSTSTLPAVHSSSKTVNHHTPSISLETSSKSSDACTEEPVKSVPVSKTVNASVSRTVCKAPRDAFVEDDPNSLLKTLRSKLEKLQEVEAKNLTVQTKLEESATLLKHRVNHLACCTDRSPWSWGTLMFSTSSLLLSVAKN